MERPVPLAQPCTCERHLQAITLSCKEPVLLVEPLYTPTIATRSCHLHDMVESAAKITKLEIPVRFKTATIKFPLQVKHETAD